MLCMFDLISLTTHLYAMHASSYESNCTATQTCAQALSTIVSWPFRLIKRAGADLYGWTVHAHEYAESEMMIDDLNLNTSLQRFRIASLENVILVLALYPLSLFSLLISSFL